MEIKKHIIKLLKVIGICYLNMLGISMVITGAMEEIIWLVILGVFVVDLSPSFTKAIWKDAWGVESSSKVKTQENKNVQHKR